MPIKILWSYLEIGEVLIVDKLNKRFLKIAKWSRCPEEIAELIINTFYAEKECILRVHTAEN